MVGLPRIGTETSILLLQSLEPLNRWETLSAPPVPAFFLFFWHLPSSPSPIHLEKLRSALALSKHDLLFDLSCPGIIGTGYHRWMPRVARWPLKWGASHGQGATTTHVSAKLNSYAGGSVWMPQGADCQRSPWCCGCVSGNRLCLKKQGPRAGAGLRGPSTSRESRIHGRGVNTNYITWCLLLRETDINR